MTAEELERALAQLREGVGLPATPPPAPKPASETVVEVLRELRPVQSDEERAAARERARLAALEQHRRRVRRIRSELEARPGARRVLDVVRASPSPCALLLGPTGVGKTTAALWIHAGFGGEWAPARQLAAAERWHPFGEGPPPAITRACTARVLYLDDLGAEETRDVGALQEVLERRYASPAGLATVTTTGLTRQQLTDRYGAMTVRRLTDQHVRRRDGTLWPVVVVDVPHSKGGQ